MKHLRIFAAVNLSIASLRALTKLQQELHEQLSQEQGLRVRWVPSPNLHVTVKFYGNLLQEQLFAVRDAARQAVASARPFALSARGLGVFPSPERPRVLWVGLQDGAEALTALRDALEDASWELGFAREARPFHPHVTLARINGGRADLRALVEAYSGADGLVSTVEELVLYESRLRRQGAEYVARARIPFPGTAAARAESAHAAQTAGSGPQPPQP